MADSGDLQILLGNQDLTFMGVLCPQVKVLPRRDGRGLTHRRACRHLREWPKPGFCPPAARDFINLGRQLLCDGGSLRPRMKGLDSSLVSVAIYVALGKAVPQLPHP